MTSTSMVLLGAFQLPERIAHLRGSTIHLSGRDAQCKFVISHRCQPHGRHAAALGAIRVAAKLARRDRALKISRNSMRGLRKNAFFRRGWRVQEIPAQPFPPIEPYVKHAPPHEILLRPP